MTSNASPPPLPNISGDSHCVENALVPTAASLASQYKHWLENTIIQQFRDKYNQADARLDLAALGAAASQVIESPCTNTYKISQGGFNQIFLLTFKNGREVIARVNMADGGGEELPEELLRIRVESEVATLKWVKNHTTIPVPEVYGYDACPNNAVGGAYILQERVCDSEQLFSETNPKLSQLLGQRLDLIWYDDVTPDQRVIIMKQVSSFEGELFKTRFPLIGSLYGDSQTGFRVGRLGPSVVNHDFGNLNDRGPWTSVRAYLRRYVTTERTWLDEFTDDYTVMRRRIFPDEDPNAQISYFKSLCDILGRIIDNAQFLDKIDPSIAHFVLFHEDIRTNNILVGYDDPTRVVGIVDWEGARVVPMWSCFKESLVAEPELTTSEQYLPLRELRRQIMFDMEPALSHVHNEVGLALHKLHKIISWPLSVCSVSTLNDYFQVLCCQKPLGEDAFVELAEFVAAQRS